jgi:pimeloyl-ACP methyl ester carboxylesterase
MRHLRLPGGDVEYRLIAGDPAREPLVFLHEDLGCVATWRRFPDRVAGETGRRALVYSRHGHGGSAPPVGPRSVRYLHEEADRVLPELLHRLELRRPILVGHSAGASIALLATARMPVGAVVAIAPHVFVEPTTLRGVTEAVAEFERGSLAARLALFHDRPDALFHSWADVWLSTDFAAWNIEGVLPGVRCPVLLVQGTLDRYGTMRQLDAIESMVAGPVHRVELATCGHSPHLERPDALSAAVVPFVRTLEAVSRERGL